LKQVLIILCLFAMLGAVDKPQLARLHYDGGGDWYNDPDIIPNLVDFFNQETGADFMRDQAEIKPSDAAISNYPFIFMTGHGNVKFSDKEKDNLREYLLNGGFLYADDDYGMDVSFRKELASLFPEKTLVELPSSHEIYTCYFKFNNGLPKIHEHDKKRPQSFALFDDYGRMMVFYTYESNISDGWASETVHDNPPEVRQKALQMGANILYYVISK